MALPELPASLEKALRFLIDLRAWLSAYFSGDELILSTEYATVAAAVTAVGVANRTLRVSTPNWSDGADTTVPANLTIEFAGSGSILQLHNLTILSGGDGWPRDRRLFMGTNTVSFAGNGVLRKLYAAWWGVVANTGTDQQDAVNRAKDSGLTRDLSVIVLPAGTVLINGTATGTAGFKARIHVENTTSSPVIWKSITFEGESSFPNWVGQTIPYNSIQSPQGTIVKTTVNTDAIFGGSTGGDFTAIEACFRNMVIQCPDNPDVIGIDAYNFIGIKTENVVVSTGRNTFSIVEPTHTGNYGVRYPKNEGGHHYQIRNLLVSGFYGGILLCEHTDFDGLGLFGCKVAMDVSGSGHAIRGGKVLVQNCPTVLRGIGAGDPPYYQAAHLNIQQFNVEYPSVANAAPAWQYLTYLIDDPNNAINGEVSWWVTQGYGLSVNGPTFSGFVHGGGKLLSKLLEYGNSGPQIEAYSNINQSINNSTLTALQFNVLDYTAMGGAFLVDQPSLSTFRIRVAGNYSVSATASFVPNYVGGRALFIWKQLPGDIRRRMAQINQTIISGSLSNCMNVSGKSWLDAGTIITAEVYQTSGSSLDIGTDPVTAEPRISIVRQN